MQKNTTHRVAMAAAGLAMTLGPLASGEVRLEPIFSDNMMVQRDRPIRVWGSAAANEAVTVTLADRKAAGKADAAGRWKVELPALAAGENLTLTAVGTNTVTCKNVIVGDIWLCGGQSNMEMPLRSATNPAMDCLGAAEDLKTADLPKIRSFKVPVAPSFFPDEHVASQGPWIVCSAQTTTQISGVGFYFAREVFQKTGVPIGLLDVNAGGTIIEMWYSDTVIQALDPESLKTRDYNVNRLSNDLFPKSLTEIEAWIALARAAVKDGKLADADGLPKPVPGSVSLKGVAAMEDWIAKERTALKNRQFINAEGQRLGKPPSMGFMNDAAKPFAPTPEIGWDGGWYLGGMALYSGMVHALNQFPIKGMLWYQGESNGLQGRHEDNPAYVNYAGKLQAFISGWRQDWGLGDFPFYIVQLTSWGEPNLKPAGNDGWAWLVGEQLKGLALPNTGLAVTFDVGHRTDIHPKNKYDVGVRLARWALARDYGQKELVPSGPLYKGITVEGNKIRVAFDYAAGGLLVGKKEGRTPVVEVNDGRLHHFAIAGDDKNWVWAEAVIDGATVLVSSPEVKTPVAVRYAYAQNPEGANLYNREGLPASPFRTDDWK